MGSPLPPATSTAPLSHAFRTGGLVPPDHPGLTFSGANAFGDPETPVFTAKVADAIRFYFVEPTGSQRSHVPVIHGHPCQRMPYQSTTLAGFGQVESAVIGLNPQSQVVGSQEGYGPAGHWNFLPVVPAGGPFGVTGDYLYRMFNPQGGYQGSWGLFRVVQ